MTKWFDYNNEDGTPGNSLPSSVNGPYYFEYNDPGTYRSDAIRSVYAELQTINNQQYYYIQSYNPNGTYGVVFDEDNQITLVAGTTYYLAGFFRFEQIDGYQIWHNSSDYDKLCGMQGSGFRWIIESGFGDVINYLSGKLTFTASVAKSSVPSWPTYDHLVPNVSPYDVNNGPYCDYSKWYAVVMGVTAYANSNGRVRLWVNGNLTTDTYGQTMETGATFFRIEMNGTIGQGEGDAPAHKRQFDRIILTDSWTDIQNGGYLSDPEEGSSSQSLYLPPHGDVWIE